MGIEIGSIGALKARVGEGFRSFRMPTLQTPFLRRQSEAKIESDVESDEITDPFKTFASLRGKADIMRNLIDHNRVEQRPIGIIRWLFRSYFHDVVSNGGIEGLDYLHTAIRQAEQDGKRLIFTPRHEADADHPTSIYLMAKAGLKVQDDLVWIAGVNMLRRRAVRTFMRSEHAVYIATPRDLKHAQTLLDRKDELGFDGEQLRSLEEINQTFVEINKKARERIIDLCVKGRKPLVVYLEAGRSYDGLMKKAPRELSSYFPRDDRTIIVPYRVFGSKEINPPGKQPNYLKRAELLLFWRRKRVSMRVGENYSSSEVWDVWKKRTEEGRQKGDEEKMEVNPAEWPMANLANVDPTDVRPDDLRLYAALMTRFAPGRNRIVISEEQAA